MNKRSLHITNTFRNVKVAKKNLIPLYSGLGHILSKKKTLSFVHAMCVSISAVILSLDTLFTRALKIKNVYIHAHSLNLEDTHQTWGGRGARERKKRKKKIKTFSFWVKKPP